ncbi:uncharacterized protein LOC123557157 [Mercenaria mercenaria]|uniref:uncharacterized protein LOC123557157 n=1 Tax=Mercenaria mercenaria TaxID=6596 RepID=UPI00234E8930|nr:uncharacterized protein LOC123557157 [Mercenaria mercenaria]
MRKQRHIEDSDPEKNKLKEERNSSPDSLQHDDIAKAKRQIQRFDEKGMNYPYKPRDKLEREHTSDLKEVKRPTKKLQDGKPADKDVKTSEREPVQPLIEFKQGKKPTPNDPLKDKKPPQIEPPPGKKQPPIEFPPGKKPIPPTTPKPDAEDTALLRIKKERERKEKERLEKKKKEQKAIEAKEEKLKKEDTPRNEIEDSKVIKNVRQSSSSDEYETDESEKQERIQKLLEKRKRLAAAAYQPPDGLPDAKVVGKKKRKNLKEGEDGGELTKSLTTREQQEILDKKRRHRKKAMKNMAKQKFKQSPSDMETSDSDADVSPNKRRFQRRKKGDPRGVEAPYTEQYHTKKGIEKELDDIDFWQEKVQPTVISDDEELDEQGNIKKRAIQVAPADTAQAPTEGAKDRSASRLAQIMEEEADVWAAHGLKGFKLGQGGELPEGFHFDEQGNIVRDVDGKVIPKEAFARLMDIRKKFGFVFSLPRLIRDSDGRPLGGYKDDEFGPTAEWDYGLPSNNEDEDEVKKSESFRPGSGKQVAFSVQDGQSVRATPLNDMDYSQIKGRQLGSAERLKLKDRLFESQPESDVKKSLPVFFAGSKGGINPESVYISNAQIERQGNQTKAGNNRVVRSDTFDDGRGLRRNSKSRSTWSGRDKTGPSVIPENEETGGQQGMQGISRGKKNIGSDDEFILVGGSMQKINKQPYSNDSHLASHWCSRYERHGNLPIRETTEMSDLNMRTAPNSTRPFSGDDKRMKKLLQELYTDKKYFDHYLEAEKLPTIAAAETRGLASHGQQFLRERAEYWGEHQAVIPVQPPSELGLRLSRMRTFHTNVDSGMDSMITSTPGRPHSADDAQETERTRRENSEIVPPLPTNRSTKTLWTKEVDNTERKPPTGRSEAPPSPSKLESGKKEKSVTIEASPHDMKKSESKDVSKTNVSTKGKNVSEEKMLPRNVLTVTDT